MARSPSDGGRRRSTRALRLALLALVAGELLYLAGANVFLSGQWGRERLNRRPEKLTVSWSRAWTVLPGLVHVADLDLAGRARRASWRVTARRGRLWIWLPSLASRHLRLLSARADGSRVSIEARPAPEGPRPTRTRRGWRLSIGRLDLAGLERLRLGPSSLEGSGRLRSSARFEVGGSMAFDHSRLSFDHARLLAGEAVAAESLTLDAQAQIDEISIGETTLFDLLASTSGTLEVEAEASSLGFLTTYLGRFPWIRIDGAGRLALALEMTDGWLAPGSRLDFTGPAVSAAYLGLTARGAGVVRGRVPEGASAVLLEAEFEAYGVERQADGTRLLSGRGLQVTISNDSTAIDRPAEGVAVAVRMPEAQVPDLRALDTYIPASTGLELARGTAAISAEVDYSAATRSGHGWLRLEGHDVVATFDGSELRADVVLDARFPAIEMESGTLALDGSTLEITGVRSGAGSSRSSATWWGRFRVPGGTLVRPLGTGSAAPAVVSGRVSATMRDTSPLTAMLRRRAPRLRWFDQLLTVENVDLVSSFRLVGPNVGLRGLEVSGGSRDRLGLEAEVDLRPGGADGVVLVSWGRLTAAAALDGRSRDWKLTRSRRWYEEQAAAYRRAHPLAP